MKVKKLQTETYTKLIITLVIAIATISLTTYLHNEQQAKQWTLKREKQHASREQIKLQNLLSQKQQLKESIVLWEQLHSNNKQLNGVQIDEIEPIMQQLKHEFKLSNIDMEFTQPTTLENHTQGDIQIASSNIRLTAEGLSDEYILSLLNTLPERLPGYIHITSFTLEKTGEINKKTITDLYKGKLPSLVKTELLFKWQDLKDTSTNRSDAS